jgi:phage tail-like protein
MPNVSPVPSFNFQVFMFDADPFGTVVGALGSLASVAKSLFFGFQEVNGLNSEQEIESYNEGGNNSAPLKFIKRGRFPNLVLKRGVTFAPDLWDWYYQVANGSGRPHRKSGVIVLNDRGGLGVTGGAPISLPILDTTPTAIWLFLNGLPEKLQGPGLNAKGNEIAIETLEISHEGLFRLGPSLIPGVGDVLATVGL